LDPRWVGGRKKLNTKVKLYGSYHILSGVKLEVEQQDLSSIVASLGKSRHYFENVRRDQRTADSLQRIRLKLIKQGEKEGIFKDYLMPANQ
jgi:ABC-type histidine transport system ATPase subunit